MPIRLICATQRPELFRAVICELPLLDIVRYDRFGSRRTWGSEDGSARPGRLPVDLLPPSPAAGGLPGLFASADSDDLVDRSNPSSCAEANADHGGPTSAAAG